MLPVSVIIITRNRAPILLRHLAFLHQSREAFTEILVVDNASEDGTPEAVAQAFPEVRIIRLPENQGIMAPRNIGAVNATSPYLFFLDDDGCFHLPALPAMVAKLDAEPAVGAVGGRVVNLPAAQVFDLPMAPYLPDVPSFRQSFRFRGGNVVIRKAALLAAGLFPARFFYGGEERDLTYRLWRLGYSVLIYDAGVLLHQKGVLAAANRRFFRNHYRNRLFMAWRSLPLERALQESLLTMAAGLAGSLATGNLLAYLAGLLEAAVALPAVLVRERQPLSRAQYRQLKAACAEEWRAENRLAGLLRNIRLQRGG
ncbi:MAG: glycosyltransferase [Thermodesulfobacteriota bacterium]